MSPTTDCVFCQRVGGQDLIVEDELAVAFPDAYPVSPGHALVVPRRHEADYFSLAAEERLSLWALADEVREHLTRQLEPAAYNLGVNAGEAAGQTVPHAHLHVIPRYEGDVMDPRGGIRHVIPGRARWWEEPGCDGESSE